MMKTYFLTDGCADCYVVASSPEEALGLECVADYFCEADEPVTAAEVEADKQIPIQMDDYDLTITHTAKEWAAIYNEPRQIASSEF